MKKLLENNIGDDDDSELKRLHFACEEWGFFQIVRNGIYRSIEHRAMVNMDKERISIATLFSPNLNANLGPAPSLVTISNPSTISENWNC
ncbi:hypothetical protein HAX54_037880 [Datura stramonium]|uniref:Non-haem dioxygenase N-terminal domain-containing protein n=1 Tax=Datura stramonium TaxID=4076 RepID=A0ABS8VMY1_DATST|nr:hypothetical protein [Datura stramonium]